jgi:hypothetical protein
LKLLSTKDGLSSILSGRTLTYWNEEGMRDRGLWFMFPNPTELEFKDALNGHICRCRIT